MNQQPKTYFGFIDDHSSSMGGLAGAAIMDSNANVATIRDAASREKLDSIVYRNDFASSVTRAIVNSNPHVLREVKTWPTGGMTALYDAIGDMITQFEAVPDYNNPNVSFLLLATTDGDENQSHKWSAASLARKIKELQQTERWTFVLRVPEGQKKHHKIMALGIPEGNIQEWNTTSAGMETSTVVTTQAMDSYVTQRAAGKRGSSSFYVDAGKVNVSALTDISSEVKLFVHGQVPQDFDGMMISEFILKRRTKYLKGAAFYQLVKTENRVGPEKLILVQDRATGKVYGGADARKMLGLPNGQNARVTPTDLAGYNIFIQSTSWNRKVPKDSGVLYYEKLGTEFSQEEIDRFMAPPAPKAVVQAPLSAQLPQPKGVVGRNIKSTMPTTQAQVIFYATRDEARYDKSKNGADYIDLGSDKPKGQRFQQTKRPSK